MFHLLTELPEPVNRELNALVPDLTEEETRILREQIQLNSKQISQDLSRLELFVLKEKYPPKEAFVEKIRKRMRISMQENDTFRRVLWKKRQTTDAFRKTH